MNKASIVVVVLGCCGAAGCSYSDSTRSAPPAQTSQHMGEGNVGEEAFNV